MALADKLQAHAGTGPARGNRVNILLDSLAGTEDHATLVNALASNMRHAAITKALREEYGHHVVTNTSVMEYRRNREVTGL